MKKGVQINLKKIMAMYFLGFISAQVLPTYYYKGIMTWYHNRIMDNLEVEERSDFYKLS
jgi:uncharacterized protein (DUF2164 family)